MPMLVAGQPDAPYALRAALQRQRADAGAVVPLAVQVYRGLLRGGL